MLGQGEAAWYAEAERRGLLKPEEQAWYTEAKRRGLIPEAAIKKKEIMPVETTAMEKAPSGFVKGIRDPIDAAAQLLTHALPKSVVEAGNKFNNWLVSKGVPLERIPENNLSSIITGQTGGFDALLRQQEQAYQRARMASGETGIDWSRMAGNILSPANLAIASRIPQAAGLGGRIAAGAGIGGLFGALQPVTQGDNFAAEKAKQIGIGAAGGAVLPAITGTLARVVRPKSSPEVQQLIKAGITPTPGQALGGVAKTTEEKMTSLPIIGDVIRSGQKRALTQFNRAVINRVLKPIGKTLPKDIQPGRDAFNYADDSVRAEYNKLLPKLGGKLDSQLQKDIAGVQQLAQAMPADKAETLNRIIQSEIIDRFTQTGKASGETLKNIESKLGNAASGYMRNGDYDSRNLGSALREIQDSIRRMIERNNPKYRGQLQQVNKAYAHFKRAERAMTYVGTEDGLFTPAQFNSAVKALDRSKDKRLFAKGKAFDQDLSNAAKTVLANRYPDSGTPGRMLANAAALGAGAYVNPATLGLAGLGSIPYLPGAQRAMLALLAQRPQAATGLAQYMRQTTPYLTPGAAYLATGLNETPK